MNKPQPQRRLTKANSTKAQRRAQQQANLSLKQQQPQRNPQRQQPQPRRRSNRRPNTKASDPYVICRLNPFASKGSSGIPDGSQVRKLVVDHRLTVTVTFGSTGTVGLMFVPALPSPIWVRHFDATTQINGVATSNLSNTDLLIPVPVSEWGSQPLTYHNTAGQYDDTAPLYTAARARIVSGAWQIMYLGTTLTDSGVVRVNTAAFGVGTALPNVAPFGVHSWSTATTTSYSVDQVLVRPVTTEIDATSFTTSANTYDTTLTRLSRGCHGLLKHAGKDYEFKEVAANTTFLMTQNNENYSMLCNKVITPTTVSNSGVVQFYDNEWDATFLTISGGTNGQSFVFDCVLCVEYAPAPSSAVYSIAKHGRPTNQAALTTAETAASKQPNSQPGSFTSSMVNAASTISTVVDVASAVAGIVL